MDTVRTVLGDIDAQELGWCQCHEHLFISDGQSHIVSRALLIDDYDKTAAELMRYKNAGGGSIVDAQPFGCGRIAEALEKASLHTEVHIVASTGFHKQIFYPEGHFLLSLETRAMEKLFVNEIKYGMVNNDTDYLPSVCAGVIKTAIEKEGIHKNRASENLFYAAAKAAKYTGVPVIVHVDADADALSVVKYFSLHDVPPHKLILCHLDRACYDYGIHEQIASTGAYLEYDTINRLKYHDNDTEAKLISHMLNKGFRENLLFSMDSTNERLISYGAEFGLDYILTEFRQILKRYDVSESSIETIMIENPKKALRMGN